MFGIELGLPQFLGILGKIDFATYEKAFHYLKFCLEDKNCACGMHLYVIVFDDLAEMG